MCDTSKKLSVNEKKKILNLHITGTDMEIQMFKFSLHFKIGMTGIADIICLTNLSDRFHGFWANLVLDLNLFKCRYRTDENE